MRDEDDEEFASFCRRYGDEVAGSILEDICCQSTTREWPWRIRKLNSESHDRERNNCTLTGYLDYRAKSWYFEIESGNWNGTVVHVWEPQTKMTGRKVPPQTLWLFASAQATATRLIIDGVREHLRSWATFL